MAAPRNVGGTGTGTPRKSAPRKAVKTAAPVADRASFARQVLAGLGLPTSAANVNFVMSWAQREGGGGAFNPLNTTLGEPGSTPLAGNSAGVQNFTSLDQGVKATIATLRGGQYGDILGALKTGKANPNAQYAGLSTWSGGGYSTLTGVAATNSPVSPTGATTYTGKQPTKSTDDATAYANNTYGYLSAFLNDPTVGPIIKQAAANNWDNAQLLGAIHRDPKAAAWWNHTAATAREFDAEAQLDPATHANKVNAQVAAITGLSGQMGFAIPPGRARLLARDSLRQGWSSDQLRQGVAAEFHYDPNNPAGVTATTAQIKATAHDYALPLSDQTVGDWATRIMGGKATTQDFAAYAIGQAKGLYPTLSAALDGGMTVQTYADPYKQIASRELGIDPNSIDFSDPKWNKALMATPDPKQPSQRVPMTLDAWTSTIRSDPTYGWGNSANAVNQAGQLGQQVKNGLGF